MSRLDDIERRLAALEAGGSLVPRVAHLEDTLGITVTTAPGPRGFVHCERCGMDQPQDFTCHQTKCPLR